MTRERPGAPVLLVAPYDWECSVGIRRLYEALRTAGFAARLVHVGVSQVSPNLTERLLLQCLEYDTTTYYPLLPEAELLELQSVVRRENPCLVGITVLSADYQACLQITRAIREATGAPILWGGVHPTFEPETSLRESGADAVCIGEGEEVIVDVARLAASGKRDFSGVPNLATLSPGGAFRRNEVRRLLQDLDAVPFVPVAPADRICVPANMAERARLQALSPDRNFLTPASVMTGFGCPYGCTYCFNEPTIALYQGKGRYLRRRSVAQVLRECEHVRDQGRRFIAFWDDIFTIDRAWLAEFAREYRARVGIPFFCYFHPHHASPELVDLVVDAGAVSGIMGVQCGSENFRRTVYNRRETNDEILQAAELLNRRLDMTYDMIVDCPYETEREWRANIELFLRFPHPFKITTSSFTWLPGCSLTARARAEGVVREEELTWRHPGGWDQCNHLQHRRSHRQMNHYILLNLTQHPEVDRSQLRDWMEDPEMMEHPERLALQASLRILEKTRRLYFQASNSAPRQGASPACNPAQVAIP